MFVNFFIPIERKLAAIMLTYNANSITAPVCGGGRILYPNYIYIFYLFKYSVHLPFNQICEYNYRM